MERKLVLIVEDDEDIQEIYRKMILDTFEDVDVDQRYNGEEGLKAVDIRKPDLIILDLLMPVMSGEAFLQDLRHKRHLLQIPVVVCSVNMSLAQKLLRRREVEGVLSKVFSLRDLVGIFEKFVGIHPKPGAPGVS